MKNIYKSIMGTLLLSGMLYGADSYAFAEPDAMPALPAGVPYINEINYPAYNANDFTINWVGGGGNTFELYEQKVYQVHEETKSKSNTKGSSRGVGSQTPWSMVYSGDRNNPLHDSGFEINYNSSTGPIDLEHQIKSNSKGGTKSVVIGDLEYNLGRGYLLTSGKHTEIASCLDLDNHSIVTNNVSIGNHTVTVAETTQDLYELLDLDVAANLSVSGNSGDAGNTNGTAYGVDAEGRYEFFNEQASHRRNKNVVFEWSWVDSSSSILSDGGISGIDPIFWDVTDPDFPGNLMLDPSDGTTNNEMNFRDACGDKYVNSITEGARVYVVFTVNEESLSDEEIENASFSLSGFVGDLFNGGLSASQTTQLISLMTSKSISTSVFVEGGSYDDSLILELSVEEDVTTLASAVNDFTQALSEDEFVGLNKSFSTYLVPNAYISDYTASQVFINYQPYLEKVQDWLNLDYQLYTRCEDIRNSDNRLGENQYDEHCSNLNNYMLNNVTYCAEGSQWDDCVYRQNAVLSPSGDNLVDHMNFYVYDYRTANSHETGTASIDLWVKKPWGTGPSATDSDIVNACLPNNRCIINTAVQHTDSNSIPGNTAPAGAGIYITDSQYESGSGHGYHSYIVGNDEQACLRSDIEVHTEDGWTHTTWAWYDGYQTIHGLCPVQNDFSIF